MVAAAVSKVASAALWEGSVSYMTVPATQMISISSDITINRPLIN